MGSNRAIVLSGGGARGAYEAGVLAALCDRAVRQRVPTTTDVVCGTSVGATCSRSTWATSETCRRCSWAVTDPWDLGRLDALRDADALDRFLAG